MEEAELLCDQLVIMDKGKIIEDGSPTKLLEKNFGHSYVCINHEDFNTTENSIYIDKISSSIEVREDCIAIATNNIEKTLSELAFLGITLQSLQVRKPSLDDLFLKLTGHHLRE
jgi:ABC-2 type transport system ATP-binding protein